MITNKKLNIFCSAILAGIFIGIGGTVFLSVGGGIPGAVLFTVGLLAVVHYKAWLYTGKVGFIGNVNDAWNVLVTLCGNIVGVGLMALVVNGMGDAKLVDSATAILVRNSEIPFLPLILRAVGCGILMSFAVSEKKVGLLWAVPVFILCGFKHSIADSYYYLTSMFSGGAQPGLFCKLIGIEVLGNLIGCNIWRINDLFRVEE